MQTSCVLKSVSPASYGDLTGRAVGIDSTVIVTSVSGFIAPGDQHIASGVLSRPASGAAYSHAWPNDDTVFMTQRTCIDVRNISCTISVDCDNNASYGADHCRYVEFRFFKSRAGGANAYFLSQKGFSLLYGDNSVFTFEDLENVQLEDHEYLGLDIVTNGTSHSMCAFGLNFDIVMQRVVA